MKLADYKKLAPGINADLKAVFAKYGITVDSVRGLIGDSTGELKLTIRAHDAKMNPAAMIWEHNAGLYGLEPSWLGESFIYQGDCWKIVGLDTKKHKYPVIVENSRGEKKIFACVGIRMAMTKHRVKEKETV